MNFWNVGTCAQHFPVHWGIITNISAVLTFSFTFWVNCWLSICNDCNPSGSFDVYSIVASSDDCKICENKIQVATNQNDWLKTHYSDIIISVVTVVVVCGDHHEELIHEISFIFLYAHLMLSGDFILIYLHLYRKKLALLSFVGLMFSSRISLSHN